MIHEYYTFDDVLLVPGYSDFFPSDANVETKLTNNIDLKIPLISAAMDTVTESAMAIKLAQLGGIGCIHKNLSIEKQALEVLKVKKHESWIVFNPMTISPEAPIRDAVAMQKKNGISGIPVVCPQNNKLVGIVTNRDVRFAVNLEESIKTVMTSKGLITVTEGVSKQESLKLLHTNRIERLIVIDKQQHCVGLITVKDIEQLNKFPNATKDSRGRLRVAAAVGVTKNTLERVEELIKQDVDIIMVDTAHGHSSAVFESVHAIKKRVPEVEVIGGNVVTPQGAESLIKAGADGIKVGMGPGSICTTRVVAGVGIPQLSAIMTVKQMCKKHKVTLIADGGIRNSGDIAKAIAAGADSAMLGSLFAGTSESTGELIFHQGRSYKAYRGMGSLSAMASGSADRYLQHKNKKLVPEGIEGLIAFKGQLNQVVEELIGGLKAAMGYTGNKSISSMQNNCSFVRVTSSGLHEGNPSNLITSDPYVDNSCDK